MGNEIITKGLLNAILDTKVEKVELDQNTILEKDIYDDKIGILDIKATLNNNVICDIEMQMVNQPSLDHRLLFYWSKLYASNMKQGDKYSALKKTIIILFANFKLKNLNQVPKGHTTWQLREKEFSKILLTDVCEIHIIELPKLKRLTNQKNQSIQEKMLLQWMNFLLTPKELEGSDMEKNEALKKAMEEYEDIQKDEHERYLAFLRMKHILDTEAIREGGFEEGIEKGKKEKQIEIAKKMLQNNIDLELIIHCTGLIREEIQELKP